MSFMGIMCLLMKPIKHTHPLHPNFRLICMIIFDFISFRCKYLNVLKLYWLSKYH